MPTVRFALALVAATAAALLPACQQCRDERHGAQFCVPDAGVSSERPITLPLLDVCSFGCGAQGRPVCRVTRDGGEVTLEATATVCELPPGTACNLACALTTMTCELGTLEPGEYLVRSPGQPARTLVVAPDAGSGECSVPFP